MKRSPKSIGDKFAYKRYIHMVRASPTKLLYKRKSLRCWSILDERYVINYRWEVVA